MNNENYLRPLGPKRHRTRSGSRSISPFDINSLSPTMYCDESLTAMSSSENLTSTAASSLSDIHRKSSSDSNSSTVSKPHHHKSIDNLCFGRARKKLNRKAQVNEVYRPRCNTDPGVENAKSIRHFTIPILNIPEDEAKSDDETQTPTDSTPSSTDTIPTPLMPHKRERSGSSGAAFGSLLKQTLKVTTASMGFRAASMERLAPSTFQALNEDVKQRYSRSTSSVSTLAQLPTDSIASMAPLQTHTECQSVQCLNTQESDFKSSSSSSSPPKIGSQRVLQHKLSTPESLQSTSIGCATSTEYSSARSLKNSSASLVPLQTLHSPGSLRSISPLRRSASSNSSSTAKHEQSTAAATAAAAATATTSTTPPEKEKKRKEVSSSRVKKFQRHFTQVSKDEKLINYFSCALVSDILLQGHLYITDQHFAFYSNVFGYVTKVVIPTSSVTKISKEKTAKIIPNAVGVATADERHVFGSFISREAAFRLMCSVCPPLGIVEILPKDPANIEISEEYSIEDESSCSISGNESPAQTTDILNSTNEHHPNDTSQTILRRSVGNSNISIADSSNDKLRHSDIPLNAKTPLKTASLRVACATDNGGAINLIGLKSVLQPALATAGLESNLTIIAGNTSSTTSVTSTPTPSTSSSPTTVMNFSNSKTNQVMNVFKSLSKKIMLNMKFPSEIHVVYLGVMLTLLLAIFSIFLLYRILDIEAKTSSYRSPVEFNWRSGNDDDIFNEALRFQKQLQLKSTEEAQNILKTNLEQIAKVRRSLETLSMLIHDRSSSFVASNTNDSD